MDEIHDFTAYSDGQIVDLYWRRDEEAISATDGKYGKYLYKLAYNIINEEDDSRSALNDTYLGAWDAIPPHRPEKLLLFLSKIARRVSIDYYRHRSAKKRVPAGLISSLDELSECIGDGGEELDAAELGALINAFLGSLEPRWRRAFVCRYYYSNTVEDIAKALAVGPSLIYRELARIRRELANCLENEGYKI